MPAMHWRDFYNVPADLIQTDVPGYQNFVRIPTTLFFLFYLIEECIHHCIKKEVINFRKPLDDGLKLAITLRHLAREETYKSLQYHWLVCQTIICKFIPKVCLAFHTEFQEEHLICSTTPEDWKQIEDMRMSPMPWGTRHETYRRVAKENWE